MAPTFGTDVLHVTGSDNELKRVLEVEVWEELCSTAMPVWHSLVFQAKIGINETRSRIPLGVFLQFASSQSARTAHDAFDLRREVSPHWLPSLVVAPLSATPPHVQKHYDAFHLSEIVHQDDAALSALHRLPPDLVLQRTLDRASASKSILEKDRHILDQYPAEYELLCRVEESAKIQLANWTSRLHAAQETFAQACLLLPKITLLKSKARETLAPEDVWKVMGELNVIRQKLSLMKKRKEDEVDQLHDPEVSREVEDTVAVSAPPTV